MAEVEVSYSAARKTESFFLKLNWLIFTGNNGEKKEKKKIADQHFELSAFYSRLYGRIPAV